jgi:hypothetical protein
MKGMLKFASDRVITEAQGVVSGSFGSTEKRFRGTYYTNSTPGPGQYPKDERDKDDLDRIYEQIAKSINTSKSSMFSSKTNRFNASFNGDPFVYQVGESKHSKRPLPRTMYSNKKRGAVGYYAWVQKTSFNSTTPRWKERRIVPIKSPGPGDYFVEAEFSNKGVRATSKKFRAGTSNRADHFRSKTGTSELLGPGYYKTETSMLKKMFNIFLYGRHKLI